MIQLLGLVMICLHIKEGGGDEARESPGEESRSVGTDDGRGCSISPDKHQRFRLDAQSSRNQLVEEILACGENPVRNHFRNSQLRDDDHDGHNPNYGGGDLCVLLLHSANQARFQAGTC